MKKAAQAIEKIISQDVGNRGIGEIAQTFQGDLFNAVSSIANTSQPSIAILTGFYIPFCEKPAAETDGPIGAAFLYLALKKAGIPTVVITDTHCKEVVKGAIDKIAPDEHPNFIVVNNLAGAWEPALLEDINQLSKSKLTHLISIERPGQASDKNYYNMKGEILNSYIEPLDLFLPFCKSQNITTICIGDGGNEAGMGSIKSELVQKHILHGDKIQSVTLSDFTIICGVSNWGGIGLSVLILYSYKKPIQNTLNPKLHHDILCHIVNNNNAIDGVLKEAVLKVDGLDEQTHSKLILSITSIFKT